MKEFFKNKIPFLGLLFSETLSFKDSADYLGITEEYMFWLSFKGVIKSYGNKRQYFRKSDLESWVEKVHLVNPFWNQSRKYSSDRNN